MYMDKHPKIYPPVYFAALFILEIILNAFVPLVGLVSIPSVGILIVVIGILLGVWANMRFRKHKTSPRPFHKPEKLVMDGPYVLTRNPMYLGFTLVLLGEAVYLGSLTPFLSPILMYYFIDTNIIPIEEKLLEDEFKDAYRKYKKSVRRWI